MSIRLQDALIEVAKWNAVENTNGWPLLREFLEWFLISCGGMRLDSSCGLFWELGTKPSSPDTYGFNSASLTDRLMTLIYGDFQGIHGIFNRMAYILERLDSIAKDKKCHEFLAEMLTTPGIIARFSYEKDLGFPEELFVRPGRHSGRIYKDWCDRLLMAIVADGSHALREGGMTAAARHIHALLGGRLDQESIRKAIKATYKEMHDKGKKILTKPLKS